MEYACFNDLPDSFLNPLVVTVLEVDALWDLRFANLLAHLKVLHYDFGPYRNLDSDYLATDRFFY